MISSSRRSTSPFLLMTALVLCLMAVSALAPRLWTLPDEAVSFSQPAGRAIAPAEDAEQPVIAVAATPSAAAEGMDSQFSTAWPPATPPHVTRLYPSGIPAPIAPPVSEPFVEQTDPVEPPQVSAPLPPGDTSSPLNEPQATDEPTIGPPLTLERPAVEIESPEPAGARPTIVDAAPPEFPPLPAEEPPKQQGWPYPAILVEQLHALSEQPACRTWAIAVEAQIDRLARLDSLVDPQAAEVFSALDELADEAQGASAELDSQLLRVELLRARYAVVRRLNVWRDIHRVAAGDSLATSGDSRAMQATLAAAEAQLRTLRLTEAWREYLLMDELTEATSGSDDDEPRRQLARRVLLRIHSPTLTEKQREFFQREAFEQLKSELRRWAHEPVDLQSVVDALERYEAHGVSTDAALVADAFQTLRWSPSERLAELGEKIDTHYRNANVRVAIAGSLINRLLPTQEPLEEDVDDDIQGARVFGRSETSTRLFVRLLPDRRLIRIGLEAQGEVATDTEAYKGPAVFYNLGLARYQARKLITVDRRGVRVWRSEAEANSDTDVVGVGTDFDGIPLLGSLARTLALQQYTDQSYWAEYEVEEKISDRANSRLDREVHRHLAEGEKRFQQKVLAPLQKLKLNPVALDMQTTQQRLIVRYRLAGFDQLAADTPRPQAPSDSMLSVQIHQSALNNTAAQLKLDGRRVDLHELYRDVAAAVGFPEAEIPEDLPEGVTLQFADQDAVSVRLREGRVTVTLRLAELSTRRGRRWRDFEVRGNYVPDGTHTDARLVRDSYVELSGKRLGLGDQVVLRGIFTRVFSQSRTFAIIPPKLSQNPKLQDLRVNQFLIDGGWIGVALGPERTTQPPAELKTIHEARKLQP